MIHIIMGTVRLRMFKWRLSHFEIDIQSHSKHILDALILLISPQKQ